MIQIWNRRFWAVSVVLVFFISGILSQLCYEKASAVGIVSSPNGSMVRSTQSIPEDLLLYDGFNYPSGTLKGRNGGYNMTRGWSENGNVSAVVGETSLEYSGLDTSGRYAVMGCTAPWGGGTFNRTLVSNGSASKITEYLDSNSRLGKPGTTLYMSFLMRKDDAYKDSWVKAIVHDDPWGVQIPEDSSKYNINIGYFGNESISNDKPYWSLKTGDKVVKTDKQVVQGQAALFVVKVEYTQSQSKISLFVDPVPGTEPGEADAYIAADKQERGLNTISFQAGGGSAYRNGLYYSGSFDELRMAASFPGAAPVMESESQEPAVSNDPKTTPGTQPDILFAEEDFNYNGGSKLHDTNGGTGFGLPWKVWRDQKDVTDNYMVSSVDPFQYSNLVNSDSYMYGIRNADGDVSRQFRFQDQPSISDYKYDDDSRIGKSGTVLWASFLCRVDNIKDYSYVSLSGSGNGLAEKESYSLSVGHNENSWAMRNGNNETVLTNRQVVEGDLYYLAIKYEFDFDFTTMVNKTKVSLFINPSTGSEPTNPDGVLITEKDIRMNSIALDGKGTSYDAFRLGTSFRAVTPVQGQEIPHVEKVKQTDNRMKLLFLGDSITQGSGSPERRSYRYYFWKRLVDAGYDVNFVGTVQADNAAVFPGYKGNAFNNQHEGHWGWKIDDYDGNQSINSELSGWMNDAYKGYVPDTAIIFLGTNGNETVATKKTMMAATIDKLRERNPDIKIYLSLHFLISEDYYIKLNQAWRQLAEEKSTGNSPIITIEPPSDWVIDVALPGASTVDFIHPNETGDNQLAREYFKAMEPLLEDWYKEPNPNESATPMVTATPQVTETSGSTETPRVTETATVTGTPTATPVVSATPTVTNKTAKKNAYVSVGAVKVSAVTGTVKTLAKIKVYTRASVKSKGFTTIKKSKPVKVKSVYGKYAKIAVGKKTGYVLVSKLKFSKTQNGILLKNAFAYKQAKAGSKYLTLKKRSRIRILGIVKEYYKIQVIVKV